MEQDVILRVEGLKKYFPISQNLWSFLRGKREFIHAVDGVDFNVKRGETFGLVGESGCGKTTLGRTIIRLYEPTAGRVVFEGKDIFKLSSRELQKVRRSMQIVFQDPYASLEPKMTAGQIIEEPLIIHNILDRHHRRQRVIELLEMIGLSERDYDRYPRHFSGGQRQRIALARSLALNPRLIVADEPVSALDVSIRAQILNLMMDLQKELGLTYIMIAHDMSLVRQVCDRVAVMYVGKIVETADTEELYSHPAHPYTRALLSAVPIADPTKKMAALPLQGDFPSPIHLPSGCRFHTRCPIMVESCRAEEPKLMDVGKGHLVACHLAA
jgi:oligopeptide/dipeptide ABC transporter ATP-binding protein